MTDVLSALFGRKKKGPAPTPPDYADNQDNNADGFVVVGNSEFLQPPSSNGDVKPNNAGDTQTAHEYESLFSFLRLGNDNPTSVNSTGAGIRPSRPAPPPPAPAATMATHYTLRQTASNSLSDAQTSAYYISGVPFQISTSLGGGLDIRQLRSEISGLLSELREPRLNEYEYSFHVEEEVIQEAVLKASAAE